MPARAGYLKVCGPENFQTLRGHVLGRELALICCGEAHEDAIDLTRPGCVVGHVLGWVPVPQGADGPLPGTAWKTKRNIKLDGKGGAKEWASRIVAESADDSDDEDEAGGYWLAFDGPAGGAGTAYAFKPDVGLAPEGERAPQWELFRWDDLDEEARIFHERRIAGEFVPTEEHDALVAKRKESRLAEGIRLFDDWLLSRSSEASGGAAVHLVLEAPVGAEEVELHVETDIAPTPMAHQCLRRIELDSDSDNESDGDPDDGTGSFIEYLQRRATLHLPKEKLHFIDPRDLGDPDGDAARDAFRLLEENHGPPPRDRELLELESLGAQEAPTSSKRGKARPQAGADAKEVHFTALPSWEAFFGAAGELLYYTPHMKADFAPLLAGCIGTYELLRKFFIALYFGTVPEAVGLLGLTDELRPLTRVRSYAFESGTGRACECARRRRGGAAGGRRLLRRPRDLDITVAGRSRVPVRAAPLDRYLKARGSGPPRTWIAGVAQRLRLAGSEGGEQLAGAARDWFASSVDHLLEDPKEGDPEGDYFDAWLRECHREIHDDVDTSDPAELRSLKWAESETCSRRYDLRGIRIPDYETAFQELRGFDFQRRASTRRERVLAKILVDGFQLRTVALAAILTIGNIVAQAQEGQRLVVVLYAGANHARSVVEFWRSQGLDHQGLPKKGYVGQEEWDDDEPRGLDLPSYLHDFSELFPVPKVQPVAAKVGAARSKVPLQDRRKADEAADQAMRELLAEEAQQPQPKKVGRKQKK